MPIQIIQAITKHKNAKWTVWHTTNDNRHHTDIYKADGVPVFQLSWYDKLSPPYWAVY